MKSCGDRIGSLTFIDSKKGLSGGTRLCPVQARFDPHLPRVVSHTSYICGEREGTARRAHGRANLELYVSYYSLY